MKQFFYMVMAACVAMTSFLSLSSCQGCSKAKGGEDSLTAQAGESSSRLTFCNVHFEDSLVILNTIARQQLSIDYPNETDNSSLADSVRAWLNNELAHSYVPAVGGGECPTVSLYAGQSKDPEDIIKFYAKKSMKLMSDELKEMAQDGFEGEYSNEYKAEVREDADTYVTIEVGHYVYSGGAHGGYLCYGKTFRRADGVGLGWSLLDLSKKSKLMSLIKLGLMEYFSESGEDSISTEENLKEYLMFASLGEENSDVLEYGFPLPVTEPWVTHEGVSFVYQQYEIASYAAGLPSFVIPFERIMPCLSAEGRALLGL